MPILDKDVILETLDFRRFWETELEGRIVSRSGVNWLAHSPFREDRHPSFSFNVENGLWNDFALGGGDVFKYVMLRYGLDFTGALECVAERYLGSRFLNFKPILPRPVPTMNPPARDYAPNGFQFFELVQGPPGSRKAGRMVEVSTDCPSGLLYDLHGQPPMEAYTSAFLLPPDAVAYRNNPKTGNGAGSLKGYPGPVKASALFFDFDCKEDPGKAWWSVIDLLNRLEDRGVPPDNIRVFFSGNKGFHVVVLDSAVEAFPGSENMEKVVEAVCGELAGDLPTFDRSIYNKTRLLRAVNSRHPKTGLFKIPLALEEVNDVNFGIEDIRALAHVPRKIEPPFEHEERQERKAA